MHSFNSAGQLGLTVKRKRKSLGFDSSPNSFFILVKKTRQKHSLWCSCFGSCWSLHSSPFGLQAGVWFAGCQDHHQRRQVLRRLRCNGKPGASPTRSHTTDIKQCQQRQAKQTRHQGPVLEILKFWKAMWVWVKIQPPGYGPQVLVLGSIYQGNSLVFEKKNNPSICKHLRIRPY